MHGNQSWSRILEDLAKTLDNKARASCLLGLYFFCRAKQDFSALFAAPVAVVRSIEWACDGGFKEE